MYKIISSLKKVVSVINVFALVTILITTFLYIGSKEQSEEIIKNSLCMFILGKFAINFLIILFYISLDFIFNKFLFVEKESIHIFLNSLIVLNVFSIFFNTIFLYNFLK
jgi:Zn-dependent protease with chaperone function